MDQRRTSMNRLILTFTLFFSLFFLSGCISLTKDLPPFTTYTISLDEQQNVTQNIKKGFSIEILEPKALGSVNSKLISYTKQNYQNETYALSKWSDHPSKLLQANIVQYLDNTNKYKYITSSKVNINTNYKLISELDNFNQEFDGDKSYAVLNIKVYLVDHHKVNAKRFIYKEACDENSAYGSVKALNKVSNRFIKDLDIWIEKSL